MCQAPKAQLVGKWDHSDYSLSLNSGRLMTGINS